MSSPTFTSRPEYLLTKVGGNKVINERAARFGLTNLAYLNVADTMYTLPSDNSRIDHSGLDCPFVDGRIGMREKDREVAAKPNEKTVKRIEKDKKDITSGLKVLY